MMICKLFCTFTLMKVVYVFRALAIWGHIERIIIDKANRLVGFGYDFFVAKGDKQKCQQLFNKMLV